MKNLISELRELIYDEYNVGNLKRILYKKLEIIIREIEALIASEKNPKKSAKCVELVDNNICYILKRKDISSISFKIPPYEKVTICMKNGRTDNFNVSENKEVLDNLIADFKG